MRRAILLTLAGLLVVAASAGLALGLEPRVSAHVGRPLAWTATAPLGVVDLDPFDAGTRALGFGRTDDVPALPVLREGDQWLRFTTDFEGHEVDGATAHGHQVVVVLERMVEGPGPSLEVLASGDDARSFVHLASVPKPSYLATFEVVRVDGPRLEIQVTLDDDAFLSEAWWTPWQALLAKVRPTYSPPLRAGAWVLRSTDGGRTFRLQRP